MANTRTSRKVAIVGVGGVGMGCAYSILNQGLVDEIHNDKYEQQRISVRW